MLSILKEKYNRKISTVILGTYIALMVVISFHFHDMSQGQSVILAENSQSSAQFPGDQIYSNNAGCQFLLNYKTNIDLSGVISPDTKLVLLQNSIISCLQKTENSSKYSQVSPRAPPFAPYI